ncbi:AMP-binding protein [bacterium]|nr:AMP-binding protein [bacterium]
MVEFDKGNAAGFLAEIARTRPDAKAVVEPSGLDREGHYLYRHLTNAQLQDETDVLAHGLVCLGFEKGDRCALMVKPGLHFVTIMFALLKAGIVPVLIDPGIGSGPVKTCLGEASPRGFIGLPLARFAQFLFGWARQSIRLTVTVGPGWIPGGFTLDRVRRLGLDRGPFPMHQPEPDETAAIIFTSGSTGVPKGVAFTHGNFIHQILMIQAMFKYEPGEVDVPTFPPFALFDPAFGVTAVFPDMDARFPAKACPAKIYQAIKDFDATTMFCSPALLNVLARESRSSGTQLPTLKRIVSAGAPAQPDVLEQVSMMLSEGVEVYTPYGATECMPVTLIGSREILASRDKTDQGQGICVGKPLPGLQVSIIRISDDALPDFKPELVLPEREIGEIVVRGPVVTRSYIQRPEATRRAKMYDAEGRCYHRMGDLGYLDNAGRLWFCGRKSHRVQTSDQLLFTIPCEAVFNTHPAVFRSALVAVSLAGRVHPVICIEPDPDRKKFDWNDTVTELRSLGARYHHTRSIELFLLHPKFPVDIRHNAKIRREELAIWAQEKLS